MTNICNHCGTRMSTYEPFCPNCGKPQPIAAADENLPGSGPVTDVELDDQFLEGERRRRTLWRALGGCLLAFLCIVVIFLAIGGVAAYQGLQERAALNRQEATVHYERGLAHMEAEEYELAIAEFEHTLRLDPTHREAREALRDAKTIALAQPTPTSATLNEAVVAIFAEAEGLYQEQKWEEVVQRLTQLRDLAPDYRTQEVSDMLYQANYNLGLQLVREDQVNEGTHAFEQALIERPGDPEASRQLDLSSLYASAQATWGTDWPSTIDYLEQLYTLTPDYLDVKDALYEAYEGYGDALVEEEAWCLAELQYAEATILKSDPEMQDKWDEAIRLCRQPSPTPGTPRPTGMRPPSSTSATTVTPTAVSAPVIATASGSILFSRFSEKSARWEILAVTPGKGASTLILGDATHPAASPNGRLLAYHAEIDESEGLHVHNVATGEDVRVTTFREDATPDWAPDNARFVFPSQRSGDRHWEIYIGWADGKGDPVSLIPGRTPAWSPEGTLIAYQGTDPRGNNPGLYLISAMGGPATRLTWDQSDRAPAWAPGCRRVELTVSNGEISGKSPGASSGGSCQMAFMSTQNGNWEIHIVDVLNGQVTRLTTSSGNDGLPTWSPDGKQIAFVSDRDGSWGIYIVPAAGGKAVKVADWGEEHADWLVERIAWTR